MTDLKLWSHDMIEVRAQCRWSGDDGNLVADRMVQIRCDLDRDYQRQPIGHRIRVCAADGSWCGLYEQRAYNPRFVLVAMFSGKCPSADLLFTAEGRSQIESYFDICPRSATDEGVEESTEGIPYCEPGEAQSCG